MVTKYYANRLNDSLDEIKGIYSNERNPGK
jgi:hypothetical protein